METTIRVSRRQEFKLPGTTPCAMVRAAAARLWLLLAALAVLVPPAPSHAVVANPYGVAVIIGNRTYAKAHDTDRRGRTIPAVVFAHRDAQAFNRYVVDVLGFDPDNVIDLRDATQAQMEATFGNERSHQGKLWRYLHPRHGSDVVVFYSGHGVPGLKDKRGYLLPADADPDSAEINGYPIDLLYENLGKLEAAKTVRVYLDACFSGDSDQGMLVRAASPVFVQAALPEAAQDRLAALTAASGGEVASWDEEARHGLFTHHLLDALYGKGDADGDGVVTAHEAKRYLDDTMTIAARRRFGRIQNASLIGVADMVLASAGTGREFPARPELSSPSAESSTAGTETPDVGEDAKVEQDAVAEVKEEPERPAPSPSPEEVERALRLTHEQKKLVQHGLVRLGYEIGQVDGVLGRRSQAGIRAYQEKKGLSATGRLTAEVAEALQAFGKRQVKKLGEEERKRRAEVARLERERRAQEARQAEETRRRQAEEERKREEAARLERERRQAAREEEEARRRRAESERTDAGRTPARPGRRFSDCPGTWCPAMVEVPAGSFMMGSPEGEWPRGDDEGPVHRVEIAQPLAVALHEVTRKQWQRFVQETRHDSGNSCVVWDEVDGWQRRSGRSWRNPGFSQADDHPVVCVSWDDARAYARWLSRKTGKSYRLLSEAEWEYVARGGTTTASYWGTDVTAQCSHANGADQSVVRRYERFFSQSGDGYVACDDGYAHTSPAGALSANAYGLHDVLGNVMEWVEDCYHHNYGGSPSDGSARVSGDCSRRVLRGGSWFQFDSPTYVRSAGRRSYPSTERAGNAGFRVARTLD